MGLKWSWAWGSETAATLETSGGWDFSSTSTGNANMSASGGSDPELTYAGSPTRYTLNLKSSTWARSPLAIGAPQGWLAGHIFVNDAAGWSNNRQILIVYGTSNNRAVRVDTITGGTLKLYVDNAFKEQTVSVFSPLGWHHIAIKYDMSTTTWTGQLYVNGVAETSEWSDTGVAQTSTYFQIAGANQTTLANSTFWSGLVHHNSTSDAGETARYVTRVSPTADVSESGSWSPASGGTAQSTALASPLDTGTVVTEPSAASGENVVVNVNNLGTQLGITPNIYGITAHAYCDGSGISVEAAVGESGTYTTGSSVAAGTATYAQATAPTNPNGGSWMSGDTVLLKFEVS